MQWIQVAKDSANNPKVERLEKSEDLLEDMYIVQGQDQFFRLALTTMHSQSDDGIDSANEAISPFFLG